MQALFKPRGRTVALFVHEVDSAANPDKSYERFFYDAASSSTKVIGWGSHGYTDAGITGSDPIVAQEVDTTSMTLGNAALPYDRTKGVGVTDGWDDSTVDKRSFFFDTGATAFDGTDGVPGDFTFSYAREFGFSILDPVADGQALAQFQPQNSGELKDAWMDGEIAATFFAGIPEPDALGVNPITGVPKLRLGVARDFDTPSVTGGIIDAGTGFTLVYAQATIPAGDPGSFPTLTVHSQPTYEFDNIGCRFVSAGSFFINADELNGLAVMCFTNPYTNGFDFGTGPVHKIISNQVFEAIHNATGFNCLIFRTGGFLGASFLSGNDQPDMLTNTKDTTDPKTGSVAPFVQYNTAPFGNYKVDIAESEDDRQRNIHTDIGIDINEVRAFPSLFILAHWSGYGTTLEQAKLVRDTTRKALEWGITKSTITPNHLAPRQVWLYEAALVDPWHDVTIQQMLTGGYVRASGTQIPATGETWGASRSYAVGDVVCDENAAEYLVGNEGWYYCTGAHTSAASGTNGPPSDVSQTRWTRCDLRLNDVGKARETAKIWEILSTAYAASGGARSSRGTARSTRSAR